MEPVFYAVEKGRCKVKVKIDNADKMFSQFIREKAHGRCERCFGVGSQVHHFYGRRHENTRFDPDNAVCVCFTCHRWFHENPEEARAFMVRKLGENVYNSLCLRANLYKKKDRKFEALKLKTLLGGKG